MSSDWSRPELDGINFFAIPLSLVPGVATVSIIAQTALVLIC
jgi:hypothetical protein